MSPHIWSSIYVTYSLIPVFQRWYYFYEKLFRSFVSPTYNLAYHLRPCQSSKSVLRNTSLKRVDSSWNVMAHGDARKGKWRGNWRMDWVASTLHTTSEHGVSSITTADAHISAPSSRLNWRPPADLNGLANAVDTQYPSHYPGTWCIQHYYRWCAPAPSSRLNWRPSRFKWTRPFRTKDEIWFLHVCHHISTGLYIIHLRSAPEWRTARADGTDLCSSQILPGNHGNGPYVLPFPDQPITSLRK